MTPDPGPLHPSLPSAPSRRTLLQAGSLVLLLGTQQIARGATILAVRVWPAPEYSRVTIESDGQLTTKQFFVTTPPRLALDIEGIDLSPELRELVAKVKPDDPNIAGIRVGQFAPGVVRLVIDLKQEARPQVFTLAPIAPYKHRLVLDLYPAKAVDPLEALISERLRDAGTGTAKAQTPSAGSKKQCCDFLLPAGVCWLLTQPDERCHMGRHHPASGVSRRRDCLFRCWLV